MVSQGTMVHGQAASWQKKFLDMAGELPVNGVLPMNMIPHSSTGQQTLPMVAIPIRELIVELPDLLEIIKRMQGLVIILPMAEKLMHHFLAVIV